MNKNKEIKHILVIRFRRIGDSVLAMALCRSLRETFPNAQIDYVLNKGIAPLYAGHPDVDHIITFDNDENSHFFTYIRKVWKTMHDTRYDVIIDMRTTFKTLPFALFSLHSPFRIGRKKAYASGIYNHQVEKTFDGNKDRVWANLSLLKPLEAITEVHYNPNFRLCITQQESDSYKNYMEAQGIQMDKPIIITAVAARLTHKIWDKERIKHILKRIIDQYDAQLIFNYAGKEEEQFARQIFEEMGRDSHIFIDIEAKSLRELCALCQNADFFFGNEGGPRHISQAMNLPSFAIYPPGISKEIWLPGHSDRFQGISPDDLLSADKQQTMTYKERFDAIGEEDVWKGLSCMLQNYLVK